MSKSTRDQIYELGLDRSPSQPSVCIPRIFNNITAGRIRSVFEQLALGNIHHIDIVERKNEKGEPFKRAYVHFEQWFRSEEADSARIKLVSGKEIKIVYDNPWFWKVSANRTPPVPAKASRPHIILDDDTHGHPNFNNYYNEHNDLREKVTQNSQILQGAPVG